MLWKTESEEPGLLAPLLQSLDVKVEIRDLKCEIGQQAVEMFNLLEWGLFSSLIRFFDNLSDSPDHPAPPEARSRG